MVAWALSSCKRVGPVQGSKSPKSGKEGFGVEKLPFPKPPKKGDFSRKIPISLQGSTRKVGIFGSKRPFLGHWEMEFFDPETLFCRLGDFDPCTGPTRSQLSSSRDTLAPATGFLDLCRLRSEATWLHGQRIGRRVVGTCYRRPNPKYFSGGSPTLTLQSLFFRFPCFLFYFFSFAVFPAFLYAFPFFSKDFEGSAEREILFFVFSRGVLAFLARKQGLEGRASSSKVTPKSDLLTRKGHF